MPLFLEGTVGSCSHRKEALGQARVGCLGRLWYLHYVRAMVGFVKHQESVTGMMAAALSLGQGEAVLVFQGV